MADLTPHGYADFLATLKQQIFQRQYQALLAVNRELVALYWNIRASQISNRWLEKSVGPKTWLFWCRNCRKITKPAQPGTDRRVVEGAGCAK